MPHKDNPEMFSKVQNQGRINTNKGSVPLSALNKKSVTKIVVDGNEVVEEIPDKTRIVRSTNNLSKKYYDKIMSGKDRTSSNQNITGVTNKIPRKQNLSDYV